MRLIDADKLVHLVQDATILRDGFKHVFIAIVNGEPTVTPEPCEDAILRQAAIDVIEAGRLTKLIDAETAVNGLRELPSVQPEPQWIPCSERMPEDLSTVITTWVNRDPLPYYEFMRDKPFTAVSVHYKGEWYWYSATCADYLEEYGRSDRDKVDKSIEIIAWMPLPEAYKEGGERI